MVGTELLLHSDQQVAEVVARGAALAGVTQTAAGAEQDCGRRNCYNAWAEVGRPFLALINDHAPALRERFGVDRIDTGGVPAEKAGFGFASDVSSARLDAEPNDRGDVAWLNPEFGFVHASRIGPEIAAAAVDAGLAITGPGRAKEHARYAGSRVDQCAMSGSCPLHNCVPVCRPKQAEHHCRPR
jgi:hypothetical protein